jgi:hypothetical protein
MQLCGSNVASIRNYKTHLFGALPARPIRSMPPHYSSDECVVELSSARPGAVQSRAVAGETWSFNHHAWGPALVYW